MKNVLICLLSDEHIRTADNALYNLKHRSELAKALKGYDFEFVVGRMPRIWGLDDESLRIEVETAIEVAISQNHQYIFYFNEGGK